VSKFTFILGGARSGKSRYAQEFAAQLANDAPVTYIATGQAGDDEMHDRIARHRTDRPAHWHTIEEPLGVAETIRRIVRQSPADPVILIDCLTFFVVNHMLRDGDAATCDVETWDVEGAERAVQQLIEAIAAVDARVVMVSNEVGMGLVPETPLGRAFRDCAGRANQATAAAADKVVLMVAGIPLMVKS
jgi:adenosylcobinamide kinase/adenosylcobinamide-phosphate guanylyltransferase